MLKMVNTILYLFYHLKKKAKLREVLLMSEKRKPKSP